MKPRSFENPENRSSDFNNGVMVNPQIQARDTVVNPSDQEIKGVTVKAKQSGKAAPNRGPPN